MIVKKDLRSLLIYSFAIVSGIFALFVIYRTGLDFFDTNSISLQMLELSKSSIYLLDLVEILIYLALVVTLTVWTIKKNTRMMIVMSISIWLFTYLEIFVEAHFGHRI
jgi:hypothetical protein